MENSANEGSGKTSSCTEHRGLAPRRTLNHLVLAVLAVALGWLAQGQFQQDHLEIGLLLYAVAIPLFATLAKRQRIIPTRDTHVSQHSGITSNTRFSDAVRSMWPWMAAATVTSIISLLTILRQANGLGITLYAASIALFAVALWRGSGESTEASSGHSKHGQEPKGIFAHIDLWLLAILAIALFLRLYKFPSIPFGTWYDEAVAGLDARRVLQDASYQPIFWESMNHPAHHLYLFALAMRLFGDNILALRTVSVLFGIGTVLAAYLFGREYGGRRWGLLFAFLVTTMRWNINFSRIAMNSIDVPFFAFLTLYFALRAARSRMASLSDLAGTGLVMGLGICFYTGFRLFSLALLFFASGWLLWHVISHNKAAPITDDAEILNGLTVRHLLLGLGVFALATWISLMPVAQFAALHQDTFWQRTQTVSIFTNRDEPNLAKALTDSAQKHLLMFNYKGDNNGRHNLPAAPMLEKLSAILFALGIGAAIARRDGIGMFFLVLLPFGLAGGIFSLDFEAPQSLRSIASLPAAVYFIALALTYLWVEWKWAAHIEAPHLSWIPALAVLGAIAISNGMAYFGRQAEDIGVWQSFSVTETLVGKDMAASESEPVYFFSQLFYDHPCIRFHAPAHDEASDRRILPLPDPFPVRLPAERPVTLYMHPDEAWVVEAARELYPQATYEVLPKESGYPPAVFVVRLSNADIASVQGLNVHFWSGVDTDAAPQAKSHAPAIDTYWPEAAPLPPPFTARWDGILYAPQFGEYTFQVQAPDRVEFAIDEEPIKGSGVITVTRILAQGNHTLRLQAQSGEGRVSLLWRPPAQEMEVVPASILFHSPVTANGLLGQYFDNPDWSGAPVMEQIDPHLDIYFHLTPLPRPYSVEWSGQIDIPYAGVYQFGVDAVDSASIFIDDTLLVETQIPDQYVEVPITLDHGLHALRIRFQDLTNRSRIHLYWVLPDGERTIIPSNYLWPSKQVAEAQPLAVTPEKESAAPFAPMSLEWQATWGSPTAGTTEFREPRDVAVAGDTVYIADTGSQRVLILTRDGTPLEAWEGGEEEPFQEPLALGIDPAGSLLVLDSLEGWIHRFDDQGRPLARIAGPDTRTFHHAG
jgi:hypothetical protein